MRAIVGWLVLVVAWLPARAGDAALHPGAYQRLARYRETTLVGYDEATLAGRRPGRASISRLWYQAPSSVRLETGESTIIRRGDRVRLIDERRRAYADLPLADVPTLVDAMGKLPSGVRGQTPNAQILYRVEEIPPLLLRSVRSVGARTSAEHLGKPGSRYDVRLAPASDLEGPTSPGSIFLDAASGMIAELSWVVVDAPPPPDAPPTTIVRASWTFAVQEASTPDSLEPSLFHPDGELAGYERVESLLEAPPAGVEGWIGREAPDLGAPDLEGARVVLRELRGSVVVLDFWATWCKPCVQSMPEVAALAKKWGPRGVVVLGVNMDSAPGSGPKVRALAREQGQGLRHLSDDGVFGRGFGIGVLPTTMVLDRGGVVRHVQVGYGSESFRTLEGAVERVVTGVGEVESPARGGGLK